MLARLTFKLSAIVTVAWAISDLIFSLEYSWILFLYRALAPLTLVSTALVFSILVLTRSMRSKRISPRSGIIWAAAILIALAPIIRSIDLVPTFSVKPPSESPTLSLLSLNALGWHDLSPQIIAEIERLEPDVVAIQEVNPDLARELESHLANRYNCKILKPALGSWGMGILARNPCSEVNLPQEGSWVGPPIIIETTSLHGIPVTIANIHAIHPHAGVLDAYPAMQRRSDLNIWNSLSQPIKDRELSVGLLLDTLGDTSGRNIIIAGDLNASMRNGVYRTIRTRGYSDSWLDRHSIVSGGTWPAPKFLGDIGLGWFLRIDFIFRSDSLLTLSVDLLPDSIESDHRGLFARFGLLQ